MAGVLPDGDEVVGRAGCDKLLGQRLHIKRIDLGLPDLGGHVGGRQVVGENAPPGLLKPIGVCAHGSELPKLIRWHVSTS